VGGNTLKGFQPKGKTGRGRWKRGGKVGCGGGTRRKPFFLSPAPKRIGAGNITTEQRQKNLATTQKPEEGEGGKEKEGTKKKMFTPPVQQLLNGCSKEEKKTI